MPLDKIDAETDIAAKYADADSGTLLTSWRAATISIARMSEGLGRIEYELIRRMEADGATEIPHWKFDVKLSRSSSWDYSRLHGLRELVPEKELAKAFTPEHEETVVVRAKWDMRKALTFKEFGREVATILEAARLLGAPRLSIKHKEDSR